MSPPPEKPTNPGEEAGQTMAVTQAGQDQDGSLLDHDLGSTRLKVEFDPTDFNMAPLSLEILVAGEPSPADMYLPLFDMETHSIKMNLACKSGEEFQARWRDRLIDAEQTKVYVPLEQAPQLNVYFGSFAGALLADGVGSKKKAQVLQELASLNMRALFGSDLSPKVVEGAVSRAQESVTRMSRDPQLLTKLGSILKTDFSVYSHSINVCMLAMGLGRFLGFSEAGVHSLGIGGMLHDVGYSKLPKELTTKEDPTPAEKELIRGHPRLGYQLLMGVGTVPYDSLMMVMHHHENADGTGYPAHLRAERTPFPARLIHIVDAYDHMITDRGEKKGLSAVEAATEIIKTGEKMFGADLIPPFVRFLGSKYVKD